MAMLAQRRWSAWYLVLVLGLIQFSWVHASEESAELSVPAVTASAGVGKVSVSETSGWPTVLLTLLGIVGLILLMAWFAKRFGRLSSMGGREIKVLSAMPVGNREKIALIDVKGTQILIGVTAHTINKIHTFDAPVVDVGAHTHGSFSEKLEQAFGAKKAPSPEQNDA